MLAPSPEFLKCRTPHSVCHEAFAYSVPPSEGEVSTPSPLAESNPEQPTKADTERFMRTVRITVQG